MTFLLFVLQIFCGQYLDLNVLYLASTFCVLKTYILYIRNLKKSIKYAEKIKKTQLFLFFSQSQIFEQKNEVFPPFFLSSTTDRAQYFFKKYFDQIGVCLFFLSWKYCLYEIWQPLEHKHHWKKHVFDSAFSILSLLSIRNDIFQRKKRTHPALILVVTQKIWAQKNEE